MAKRFTDTDKWKKPLLRGLKAPYKLLWLYILDDCDHSGIWIVDLEVAGLRCGYEFKEEKVLEAFSENVEVITKGQEWFIRDFIDFQYGELNPENRVHKSVLNNLKKHKIKPLKSPLKGVKDKDKKKEKDTDGGGSGEGASVPFDLFWDLYDKKLDKNTSEQKWNRLKDSDRESIIAHVPRYVKATPDKAFRKHPSTYLNQKTWLDEELPIPNTSNSGKPTGSPTREIDQLDNDDYP